MWSRSGRRCCSAISFCGRGCRWGMTAGGWIRRWRGGRGSEERPGVQVLTASVLPREGAPEERPAIIEIVRKIIEDSGECLVILDERGKILEASRPPPCSCFRPADGWMERSLRNYFPRWRAMQSPSGETGSVRLPPSPTRKKDAPPPDFEAALERGGDHSHAPAVRDRWNGRERPGVAHSG